MPKRLIDLDDELLAAARRELNTDRYRGYGANRAAAGSCQSPRGRVRSSGSEGGGLAGLADRNERDDVWR